MDSVIQNSTAKPVFLKTLETGEYFRFDNGSSEAQKKHSIQGSWMVLKGNKILPFNTKDHVWIVEAGGQDIRNVETDHLVFKLDMKLVPIEEKKGSL